MAIKIRLYKRKFSGNVQTPSNVIVECVAGIIEVSEGDAAVMRRCGWGDPPGGAKRVEIPDEVRKRITEEDILKEFAGLLEQGTVELLKQIPEIHQESAVEAGATDYQLAASVIAHRHGVGAAELLPKPRGTAEPEAPAAQPESESEAGDESYSQEDLMAMTVKQLLEFVSEDKRLAASKLKKADLIQQILGQE